MRKHLIGGLLTATALVAMTVVASANDTRLRIHNKASRTVFALYSAHIAGGDWGPNLLDEGLLPGEVTVVDVDDGLNWCRFRFRALFKGGGVARAHDINACERLDVDVTD